MTRHDRRISARWPLVAVALALTLVLSAAQGCQVTRDPVARLGPLSIRGADISFTLQEEAIGKTVRGPGGEAPIEKVLAGAGADTVRLRLWVNPVSGTSSLPAALELARRAAAAGLRIILALHYADTWADHSVQSTPAAWRGLNPEALAATVRTYSAGVVRAFADQGTPVSIVQVGNEIDNGLLWPVGRLDTAGWDAVARLVAAGAAGARSGGGSQPPKIMVHLASSGHTDTVVGALEALQARGVRPDLVGLSYYPWWNGDLAVLQRTLDAVADQFDVDVLVAETAYPWTLANGDSQPNAVSSNAELPDGAAHPATPAGQASWAEALRQVVLQVPRGHGAGFLFWEPGWLPGVNATPGHGSAYDNTTLFTWDGDPLPALASLRPPGTAASPHG